MQVQLEWCFDGFHREIIVAMGSDYRIAKLFARKPPAIRRFLLRTLSVQQAIPSSF